MDACDEPADGLDGELRVSISFSVSPAVVNCVVAELVADTVEASRLRARTGERERLRFPMLLM
jgi:hypothetical protein